MRLYVIGPVTGVTEDNRPAFEAARRALREAGCEASIPHSFIGSGCPHDQAMFIRVRQLTIGQDTDGKPPYRGVGIVNTVRPYYDGVALLDGWENSPDATLERQVAEACGIEAREWRDWL